MYEGGRPGAAARRSNRAMAYVAASGVLGWWCVRLETVKVDGRRYIVSMLGQGARWVRNVRALTSR
jgi:hypothetical protein